MTGVIRVGALVTAGLVLAVAAALGLGMRLWTRTTNDLVAQLAARANVAAVTGEVLEIDRDRLDRLPPPVARYFAFALPPGQRRIRHAELRFTGQFAARPNAWSPFTAEQHINAQQPGFVWDARIAMMPVVPVLVRDSYVNGEGAMRATAGGLVPFVNQKGTPEMAAASLQRFLAEAVWVPTALLPRVGLTWSGINDTNACVTLTDGATTVSMNVHFGRLGEIETVSAMRYRDVNGKPVLTPWVGEHRDYAPTDGMMIPTSGEVAWVLPDGRLPYWRGRLINARYDR